MAKKPATKMKVNKSAAIREMLKLHPSKGPTEISKMLKDTQGISAPPSMVSNIKAAGSKKKKSKRGRPKGSKNGKVSANGNGSGLLDSAFEFVGRVGGLVHAEKLIDKLKEWKSKL